MRKAAMTGLHRVMKDNEISMHTKVRLAVREGQPGKVKGGR